MSDPTSSSLPVLGVITASTRPGRVGRRVADWFVGVAAADGRFDVRDLDLATIDLPLLNEPFPPAMRKYTLDHTKAWSETITRLDGVVLVMPEYNGGYSAPLKNALDYLVHEWAHKPVGLVHYGYGAKGVRAAQLLKPVLLALNMHPLHASVGLSLAEDVGQDGVTGDGPRGAAEALLNEMARAIASYASMRT